MQGGPKKGRRFLSGEPSITRFGAIRQLDGHDPGKASRSMGVIDPGSQDAQFAPNRSGGTSARLRVASAAFSINISNRLALPERHQHLDSCGDTPWRCRFRTMLLGVIGENVGYEDLCWVPRSGIARPDVEEVRECGFSEFAVRSAR